MKMYQRERLMCAYNLCFSNGFSAEAKAHMMWYIEALLEMELISDDEATIVRECITHEVSKLTDNCLNYFKY